MEEILTTVFAISGITGLLAFLLSLANKTIADYGEKNLTINEEKDYVVSGGDSLLSALNDENIFIPSACGGKGSCGYCKVKVLSGGGPFLATERGYVSDEEQQSGIRLSCQVRIKKDMHIEIPEELFSVRQYLCTVTVLEDLTDTIKRVGLSLPEGERISYKPGQYIQILTPEYDGNEEVYRAYSITTPPSSDQAIELFIGYVPNGICTTYIHQYLKVTDVLTIVGPFGDFYYRDTMKEMICVAIGTGMAPIMSILRHMNENNIQRKITFFFGARTRQDLFMTKTLQSLEESMYDFTYINCLSRPTKECQWKGETGRVTDLVKDYVADGENKEAYLCGSPAMIDSVLPLLKQKGFSEDAIYFDRFD
jgi:Na+-transporting NADH:ubiquinone oxidoreductase subunit F